MELTAGLVWLLVASALVLFMTPGLAFFYGGMTRAKSALNMMMMSFVAIGTVGIMWVLWGASMATSNKDNFFQIFANPGYLVDWNAPPFQTVKTGTLSVTLTGLGDELPYAFAVRACSVADVCDQNTVTRQLSLTDAGAPKTPGITAANVVSGSIELTTPWAPGNGAVRKRRLYRRSDTSRFSLRVLRVTSLVTKGFPSRSPPTHDPNWKKAGTRNSWPGKYSARAFSNRRLPM